MCDIYASAWGEVLQRAVLGLVLHNNNSIRSRFPYYANCMTIDSGIALNDNELSLSLSLSLSLKVFIQNPGILVLNPH